MPSQPGSLPSGPTTEGTPSADVDELAYGEQMARLSSSYRQAMSEGDEPLAQDLRKEQGFHMLKQWTSAKLAGEDPLESFGQTGFLDPDLLTLRAAAEIGERQESLRLFVENPEVEARVSVLEQRANEILNHYREINRRPLSDFNAAATDEVRRQRIMELKPAVVSDEDYHAMTNELQAINREAKAIWGGFNVHSHPRTAKLAAVLTRTVGPSARGFIGKSDPGVDYTAFVPEFLEDLIPEWAAEATGRAAGVAYAGIDSIAAASGVVGVAAYDGVTRLAAEIESAITGQPSTWEPTSFFGQDENGQIIPLEGGKFSLPEIAGIVHGALTQSRIEQSMAKFRWANERQETFSDMTAQGILQSLSSWVGGFRAFGATGGAAMAGGARAGQALADSQAVVRGTAWLFGSASPRAAKLRTLMGQTLGASTALGTYDSLIYGTHEGFLSSFAHGAMMAPVMRVADGVAGRFEILLNRGRMPSFLARAVGGMMEGTMLMGAQAMTGQSPYPLFGPQSPEGRSLWDLIRDPSEESWRRYVSYVGENVLGSMVQRAIFGRRAMIEREAQAAQERAMATSRVDVAVTEQDVLDEDVAALLPRDRAAFGEAGRRITEEGRIEAEMEARGQRLVEPLEGGRLVGGVEGTENLVGRMMAHVRGRVPKLGAEGVKGAPTEIGVMTTRVRDRVVAVPIKGTRGELGAKGEMETGPTVSMSRGVTKLAEALRKQGVAEDEIGRIIESEHTVDIHTHPTPVPFSIDDIRNSASNFAKTSINTSVVVTSEGGFTMRRRGDVDPDRVDELQRVAVAKTERAAVTEAAQKAGLTEKQVDEAVDVFFSGSRKVTRPEKAAIDVYRDRTEKAMIDAAAEAGIEIRRLSPSEMRRSWASYVEGRGFDPGAVPRETPGAAAMQRAVAGEVEAKAAERGEEPRDVAAEVAPLTESQRGEVVTAYNELAKEGIESEQAVDKFISTVGRETVGAVADEMSRTPSSVAAILEAAEAAKPLFDLRSRIAFGVHGGTGETFVTVGRKTTETKQAIPRVRGVEKAPGEFIQVPLEEVLPGKAEGAQFPGAKSAGFEPTTERPPESTLREIGRMEARVERPEAVPGTKALESVLGARPITVAPGPTLRSSYERAKSAARTIGNRVGRFFTDTSYREELAKRIEAVGYRRKFLALKEDETAVLAETDVVREQIRSAPEQTKVDRARIMEPIIADESIGPDRRRAEIDDVIRYAVLRDLSANYLRKERSADGTEIEVTSKLPIGTTIEAIRAKISELEGSMSGRQKESYARLRSTLDDAWSSIVRRGLAKEEGRVKDYFPRRISDWGDILDSLGPNAHRPPVREPFRGYLRRRAGTERVLEVSLDVLTNYLNKVRIDNAIHDYNERIGRRVQSRLFEQHGLTEESIRGMSRDEWVETYSRLEKENGLVVMDVKQGRLGERTLERDPTTQKIMADIAAETGAEVLPEAALGYAMRPNSAMGRYLVTKKLNEFLREARRPSEWHRMPLLNALNRVVGKWFKGPALRGLLGTATPFRAARNLVSDVISVGMKHEEGFKALRETLGQMRSAHRITRAHVSGDERGLTDLEASMLEEMRHYGTLQATVRGAEEATDSRAEREWIQKVMPETTRWIDHVSSAARGDFEWARKLDAYSENLMRSALFLRERLSRFSGSDEVSSEDAHIKVGEVLINYNHLTPGERVALNGLTFPFYTWAKGNFFRTMGMIARQPIKTPARYALYAAPAMIWNYLFAREEEERLWSVNPSLASKFHLILPYARDELGNPMIVSFDDPYTDAMRMLGLDTIFADTAQFALGHRSIEALSQEPVKIVEGSKMALRRWTAPWIRSAIGGGAKSKFTTTGEKAETLVGDVGSAFRPLADLQALADLGKKRRSKGQRWLKLAPFVGFVDVSDGVVGRQVESDLLAGRLQASAGRLSHVIGSRAREFLSAVEAYDPAAIQDAISGVVDDAGDDLERLGMSEIHVVARLQRTAERLLMERAVKAFGSLSPRFMSLSRAQQAELLFDMMK